jgi:hypothetical protein
MVFTDPMLEGLSSLTGGIPNNPRIPIETSVEVIVRFATSSENLALNLVY